MDMKQHRLRKRLFPKTDPGSGDRLHKVPRCFIHCYGDFSGQKACLAVLNRLLKMLESPREIMYDDSIMDRYALSEGPVPYERD